MKDSDPGRHSNGRSEEGTEGTVVRRAEPTQGPMEAFLRSIKLFFTKDMGLLSVAFFYIGKLSELTV